MSARVSQGAGRFLTGEWDRLQQGGVDQRAAVSDQVTRDRARVDQQPDLEVLGLGGLGEIGGRDEHRSVIDHDALRVQTRALTGHGLERPGVVIEPGQARARPLLADESLGEPPDLLAGAEVVAVGVPDVEDGTGASQTPDSSERARVRESLARAWRLSQAVTRFSSRWVALGSCSALARLLVAAILALTARYRRRARPPVTVTIQSESA